MKTCSYCGTINDDSKIVCDACSGLLPESESTTPKKSRSFHFSGGSGTKKLIAGGLAALTVVGGGTAVWLGGSTSRQVTSALSRNEEAIVEQIEQLPNLTAYAENFAELNDGGKYTISADITTSSLVLDGIMHYDRKGEALSGSLGYADESYDVQFDFASDDKEFTVSADRLTADIYGFKLKEFAKMYSKTPLAAILPITNGNDEPNLDFFAKLDFAESMEEKYGDAWKNFKKSLDYEELNERRMEIGGQSVEVQAYEITWDTSAATKLVSAILGKDESFLDGLTNIFAQMEPDCRFYVDDNGYVVAVDFVAAGNKCVLTFEGTENIWDVCTLTSQSISGGEGAISGFLVIEGRTVSAEIQWDGVMEYALDYNDTTGAFALEADVGGTEWYLDGTLTSTDGGAQLRCGGYLPTYGRVDVRLNMDELQQKPELMSDKYVDLMDMDLSNWQRLLIDINNSN